MTMTTMETRALVRSYHDAWSAGRFPEAVGLLSDDLCVEVPINDYPTRDSFAAALEAFGGTAREVRLLAELTEESEAMLLYDATFAGVGRMRIAEHFTVKSGRIVRLRQIHDTAALRAARLEP